MKDVSPTTSFRPDNSDISLEWTNITLTEGDRVVLQSMSGYLESGKLTALIGPSGSGKQSLISVLSGRVHGKSRRRTVSGEISVCGELVDTAAFLSNVGCVMSDDVLLSTATPYEALYFCSALRVLHPQAEDRDRIVKELLRSLKLEHIENTPLYSPEITAGELKRVSIGVELVGDPLVLFLDEPFTNLDSFAAYTCMNILKDVSASGVPILISLQRPTTEVIALFDEVIVLNVGEVLYHGRVDRLTAPFEAMTGQECRSDYNPADFVLFAICKAPTASLEKRAKDQWKSMEANIIPIIQQKRLVKRGWVRNMVRPRQYMSILMQVWTLVNREVKDTVRNKFVLFNRFFLVAVLNFVLGVVFWSVGGKGDETYYIANVGDWQGYYGGIATICISAMFMNSQAVLLSFPTQRKIFVKEFHSNMYGSVAYFIARTAVELPLSLLQSIIQMIVVYWSMNLQGSFGLYVMVLWLVCVSSSNLASCLSSVVRSEQRAIQLSPVIYVPQILFSGLFVSMSSVNQWLRWGQYACFLKYCMNMCFYVEFGQTFTTLASKNDIDEGMTSFYIGLIMAMLFATRALSIILLRL